MSDSARTPQIGDTIVLRGLARAIVRIDRARNKVWFANPPSHPAPEHGSREGACALSDLRLVQSADGAAWHLPGASDEKTLRPGAIQLGAAVFDINGRGSGSGAA